MLPGVVEESRPQRWVEGLLERAVDPATPATPRYDGRESDNKITIDGPASADKVPRLNLGRMVVVDIGRGSTAPFAALPK